MDARPTPGFPSRDRKGVGCHKLARVFNEHGLEAVLIGNPAATFHLEFTFRKSPDNLRKLKAAARSLHATILKAWYPPSNLYRLVRDDDSLQVDFVALIGRGASLAKQCSRVEDQSLTSKAKSAAAPARRSNEPRTPNLKVARHEALKRESELALRDQIRRLLAKPPDQRTHFLRKRIGFKTSCL